MRREIERQAEAEKSEGGPDMPQIGGAGRQHARMIVEQPEPGGRPYCGGDPDHLREAEGDGAANQRDVQSALLLAGADIGADQRDQGRTEAEHQRYQQKFEPVAGAVAGDRLGPGCEADQGGRQQHRQTGLKCADRPHAADPQDVGK